MARSKNKKKSQLESKLEDRTLAFLKGLKGARKFQIGYETEKLPYTIHANYVPDFVLEFKDGRKLYIETKGYFDDQARKKMEAVKKDHPDIDLRIVFERDNPIRKRAKSRYSDWATKHGYVFAIGAVPEEWLL